MGMTWLHMFFWGDCNELSVGNDKLHSYTSGLCAAKRSLTNDFFGGGAWRMSSQVSFKWLGWAPPFLGHEMAIWKRLLPQKLGEIMGSPPVSSATIKRLIWMGRLHPRKMNSWLEPHNHPFLQENHVPTKPFHDFGFKMTHLTVPLPRVPRVSIKQIKGFTL